MCGDNWHCLLFPVCKCVWDTCVKGWGHRVFLKTYMSPMASGVTISNPDCSYLSFPHELSKAFENKQVREFPKIILTIHSDTCCDSGPRLAPLCEFSWSRTLRFFSLLVQEWNSILYCQVLWSEIFAFGHNFREAFFKCTYVLIILSVASGSKVPYSFRCVSVCGVVHRLKEIVPVINCGFFFFSVYNNH